MPAPTIKHVARASGVSTTTVSFVLNGTGSVGAEVRERVLRVAAELGYTPDPLARAMITRRTRSLGVLVNNVEMFISSAMLGGIERAARAGRYEILLALHRDDPDTAHAAVRDIVGRRVDAVIAVFDRAEPTPAADALAASGVPHLIAYYRTPDDAGNDNVVVDQEQGGYLAARHLLDSGRRRIAYLGGAEHRNATRQRLAGYRRALAEGGAGEPHPGHVRFSFFSVGDGMEMADVLWDAVEAGECSEPDAVLAGDDSIAAGVLRVLRQRSRRVPEDVAVVGFNDGPLCEATDPPLTSVHMPLEEVGRLCVERAIMRLDHAKEWAPAALVLPCTLTVRESG